MITTNFYLKDPKAKKRTLIYLFFRYNGNRFKYSTSEFIHPKYWNEESQRGRASVEAAETLNRLLEHIESEVLRIYREGLTNGDDVDNKYLGKKLDESIRPEKKEPQKGLIQYFHEYIESQRATKSKGTINKYKTLFNHLLAFQTDKHFELSYEKIDLRFYDLFTVYCIKDVGLLNNTSGKYMKMMKTFMKWSTDRGLNSNMIYQKFKVSERDADIIYLTMNELNSIMKLNLKKKPKLERVRDIFCFGCFTGLRYSDIIRLKKVNIKDDEIIMVSEKTTDKLNIPLNNFAKNILVRYDYKLPVISIQKANDFLKEIGKLAKVDEAIVLTKFRGVEEIQINKPKYELLTTHTARRTFVTLSLERGMRPETAMSITGHKDYKTFKKYIKITSKVRKAEMKQIWDNTQPLLKVVK